MYFSVELALSRLFKHALSWKERNHQSSHLDIVQQGWLLLLDMDMLKAINLFIYIDGCLCEPLLGNESNCIVRKLCKSMKVNQNDQSNPFRHLLHTELVSVSGNCVLFYTICRYIRMHQVYNHEYNQISNI